MPALRSLNDDLRQLQGLYPPKPQAHLQLDDPDLDMHMRMSMSMSYPSIGILSPTPRALTFPQHAMLDLDGPTPRAFAFPASVHDALGPPLTPPEPSPSTPSASPSPFEPDRANEHEHEHGHGRDQDDAPPAIARRSQSQQRIRTQTASPAAQISSFNAPDAAPGAPITLAYRRRGSSISSLALPLSTSTHSPAPNPHAHAIQLNGPERKPKRGDEDYIKRPENAFILFRRECCLKKNQAEAAAASEGDPVARRQRQADLSKTISQQWRSLSAEDRKYWDDLAKQRKKEHEEMYPWYVYQPTRAKEKKGKPTAAPAAVVSTSAGGKAKRDGKKERREKRDKSSSRVRSMSSGHRARGLSSCSTASTASSSASTIDSEDFDDFDSADGYASERLASYREVRELEMGDLEMGDGDFDMTDSESSSQQFSLPMNFMMPALGNGLSIDTRNALASFSLESGPLGHHGHHGHGHSHSLSAQIPAQSTQSLGPLSFVLPQGRRSTSAPGASTPPPVYPPTIKIPTLLPSSNSVSSSPAPNDQSQSQPGSAHEHEHGSASSEGMARGYGELSQQEQHTMQGFQFPTSSMNAMGFAGLSGQVPDFSTAGGEMHHNNMFQMYEQQVPDTAKPARVRALSQIAIPSSPSAGGPLSAPAQSSSSMSAISPHRLYLPSQQQQNLFSPSVQSPSSSDNGHLHVPMRAIPMGLPESPKPNHEWDETLGLPSWAMPVLIGPDAPPSDAFTNPTTQAQSHAHGHGPHHGFSLMGSDGEIDIDISGLPSYGYAGMGEHGGLIGGMGMGMGSGELDGEHSMDPYAMHFNFEDLLNPSQL